MQEYSTVDNPRSKGKNSYVSNLTLAQYSQYYIDCKRNPKSTLCLNPPSYLWGGMGWYERRDEHTLMLNLHGNDPLTTKLSKSHPGLDCSGFTYAVFANAKLRVTTDLHLNPSFETADNTPARSYMALDDKSCFREIPYGKNPSAELRHGDLLVWKTHMLIIDTLGEDPFGINHISGIADCSIDKIKPEQATLTIFNSKGGFTPHQADVIKN